MSEGNPLPKSAVEKPKHPVFRVVPDGVSRMSVGDVVNTTGVAGLVADPDWEVDTVDGPIEVREVDPDGKQGRFYDVTANGAGDARIVFIESKSRKTFEQRFSIT